MHVSCSKCGIEDILEFSKNPDEVFLEFLGRFDKGLVTEKGLTEGLADEGIIRSEKEIKEIDVELQTNYDTTVSDPTFFDKYQEKKNVLNKLMEEWEIIHLEIETLDL